MINKLKFMHPITVTTVIFNINDHFFCFGTVILLVILFNFCTTSSYQNQNTLESVTNEVFYILWDILVCSITEYLIQVVLYFDQPVGWGKIETSKNYQATADKKCLISYPLSNCFFFSTKCFWSFLMRQESKVDRVINHA